jgi:NTP pyrophosphatase (non-canonical NTP hydrolase)
MRRRKRYYVDYVSDAWEGTDVHDGPKWCIRDRQTGEIVGGYSYDNTSPDKVAKALNTNLKEQADSEENMVRENRMTPEEYIKAVCKTESVDFDAISKRLSNLGLIRLLHAAMGLETEVGEIMDQLKKHIFYGKELDTVNLMEELGDLFWYTGIMADTLDFHYETIWERNIAKLKARYGDKFSETRAEDRDLERERGILEGEKDAKTS